jgi:hypothetical protein
MMKVRTAKQLWQQVGQNSFEYKIAQKFGFGDEFRDAFIQRVSGGRGELSSPIGWDNRALEKVFASLSRGRVASEQIEQEKSNMRMSDKLVYEKNKPNMPPAWS